MNSVRATIRDVAQRAGVSVTTVSHALNGKGKVSAGTVLRVQVVAEELGYQPSPTAQALRKGRTGAIALIMPREDSEMSRQMVGLDYYMQVAAAAATSAFAYNRPLVLPPDLKTTEDWGRINPDGVLLCDPIGNDPHIDILESMGVPVVTIERDSGRPDWKHYVSGDNRANTREVLDHLRRAGARRIALLTTDWTRSWSGEIDAAHAEWCRDHDQPLVRVSVPVQIDQSNAYEAAGALLDSADPPDAFYAPAEGYSIGVMRACSDRGLRVPDDVLLVCGNDGRESRESTPTVTAIDLLPDEQTKAAIDLLIGRINRDEVTSPVFVPSILRVRASTTR